MRGPHPFPDLLNELSAGPPFFGPIDGFGAGISSGNATIGPFIGAPSGVTIYANAFGSFPGANGPAIVTPPISYTIP